MTLPIESILGIDRLTGIVANPAGGVPMPESCAPFMTQRVTVDSMTTYYIRTTNVRNVAQLTDVNAPAKSGSTPDSGKIPVTLAHSREFIMHGVELLQKLISPPSDAIQERAIMEIGRKSREFARRFDNLRITACCSAITKGKIYFDKDGNLLPSSSNAQITVDFNLPANNLNNTGIGAWNTASTDIPAQIAKERRRLAQLTGLNYRNVIYGPLVPGYLAVNDMFENYIHGAPTLATAFASNTIPQGFAAADLVWRPSTDMWYQDSGGTMRNWVGDSTIILYPDPSPDWFDYLEGPYLIPNDLGSVYGGSEAAASGGFASVVGRFAYATKSSNPPGIQHFIGDTFLPVIKVPGAVRICEDVTQAAT